ncbi:MAG: UDP-N-acetylmuramoyl-L-alanine--D-glutamate ligase, partial [Nitrospirae bacterium]
GKDKGGDFSRLRETLARRVKQVIVIGEASARIRQAIEGTTSICHALSLQEAVSQADRAARSGDVVLLSPACASFDMFRDYRDRGEQFRRLVWALP